jgi:hypothetical protein
LPGLDGFGGFFALGGGLGLLGPFGFGGGVGHCIEAAGGVAFAVKVRTGLKPKIPISIKI